MDRIRHWTAAAGMFVYGLSGAAVAAEDAYPSRPIRLIVPLSAGAADTLSRTIGQKLRDSWGQPVVVENRPGGGTTIGTEIAAKAAPDGYTLIMATFSHAVNATYYRKLPYDTLKSFDAVTLVAVAPNVLVVNPSLPAKSCEDLIALAKREPGQLNFASAGTGSSSHLAGELFRSMAGINIVHVPYKGAAPALNDLLGGHVQLTFDPLPSSIGHIKSAKLRALAVTTSKRSPLLNEVPTVAEAGVPGYELNGWSGFLAPAGMSKEVLAQLNTEIVKILNMPEIHQRFSELGFNTVGNSPQEFQRFIEQEVVKWGNVVKTANISAD
jgi:tripartite-type tricarboxylate transporter receptor subunit TctC